VAVALVTLFGALPVAIAAGLPLLSNKDTISYYTESGTSLSAPFPVDAGWKPTVRVGKYVTRISWPRLRPLGATMDYVVLREWWTYATSCNAVTGAAQCVVHGHLVSATHRTEVVDHPAHGKWTYRIAAVASWINDPTAGNIFVAGPPVTVTVTR